MCKNITGYDAEMKVIFFFKKLILSKQKIFPVGKNKIKKKTKQFLYVSMSSFPPNNVEKTYNARIQQL
jgi:hypothetical protein